MTFQILADAAVENIGISFEWTILIITVLGSMIFFAKDFKIGMIILMVTTAGLFIWFYESNMQWELPLTVFFMSLVILALSLYAVNKNSTTGGFTG